eukprot:4766754-Pleurochrysis_carterae.AAC.1
MSPRCCFCLRVCHRLAEVALELHLDHQAHQPGRVRVRLSTRSAQIATSESRSPWVASFGALADFADFQQTAPSQLQNGEAHSTKGVAVGGAATSVANGQGACGCAETSAAFGAEEDFGDFDSAGGFGEFDADDDFG